MCEKCGPETAEVRAQVGEQRRHCSRKVFSGEEFWQKVKVAAADWQHRHPEASPGEAEYEGCCKVAFADEEVGEKVWEDAQIEFRPPSGRCFVVWYDYD